MRDAEFVVSQPGGNIRVGLGVNVWIHANRDRRGFAHGTGDFRQDLEFRFGFDIEAVDTHFQSPAHFARLFAYAAKHDFGWVATCQNDTFQLALADDVKAGAGLC